MKNKELKNSPCDLKKQKELPMGNWVYYCLRHDKHDIKKCLERFKERIK